MIYLQEGNFPLNEAFSSEIVQEANSTYQLTFKFPTSDPKWALLTPETELVADDLHGEQYFSIFEVEKQHGYVTVYANQVATLLNGYSINKINVDRVNGATVMNALVAGFKRETPFTFFSDVMSKHTLNLKDISAMEALAKDKHSIVGQWGGDLVRDKYSVRLLENGGIENESLFAYKKNMKSFQESKSTKELRTRIHFKKVIEAHEEGKKDQILTVTIDSQLINKYKHIYEADMEVQDQDVVDQKTLEEYGKRYFRETLCDMIEESLEIDVVGQADQPVHMFDIVSLFHEGYDVDLRKKITKYKFNPMSIKLVSIGFGEVARTLADSISGMVNDSVDKKMKSYDAEYEAKVQKLVDNANAEYDKQAKELEHKITDGIEQAKAQAEVVKQEISAQVTDKINAANQANKNEIVEEFKAQYNGIEVKMQGLKATTDQLKTSDADIQKLINDFKDQTQSQFVGIQGAQSRFEQTTEKAISDLTNVTNGKADRSYVEQTVAGVKEEFTTIGVGGGPNMLRNSRADEGLKYWTEPNNKLAFTSHKFYFNGQKRMFELRPDAVVKSPRFIVKRGSDYMLNMIGFDANSKSFKIYFCKRKKGNTADFEEKQVIFEGSGSTIFNSSKAVKRSFKFNVGDFDDGYLQFEYVGNDNGRWAGLFMTELDFYEGTNDRKWQPAPEDSAEPIEAVRTQVTQLAGSWAVKNLNSNGDVLNSINVLANGTNRIDGRLTHITGQTKIDNAVIKDGMIANLNANKITGGTIDASQINVINVNASNILAGTMQGMILRGGRIEALDGSLSMDLNNKKIRLNGDNVGIVREFNGYPTQFIRYEAQRENNQNHARTIIGSNRNGSENWNSASFSGVVIDNNSNNSVDKIFQFGDYNYMRHASGDDGWNFSVVTQTLVPGTWNKNSEIWCRHFVIPKKTKSDTDSPTEFIRLDESVAALWKLWAHALGQINMTGAMKAKVQSMLDTFSYNRDHII